MLRVILEYVPFGDEAQKKTIGTLNIINDGSGTQEAGNYVLHFWEETDPHKQGRSGQDYPQRLLEFPRKEKRAWDLALVALRRFLEYRNPYQGFASDEKLYIRQKGRYVPVAPFQGFPMSGVMLVHSHGEDTPGVRRASYRWIGDIPPGDALTHAAAQVHHDRACKALGELKPRADGYGHSLAEIVDCVLGAIAQGNLKAQEKIEAAGIAAE